MFGELTAHDLDMLAIGYTSGLVIVAMVHNHIEDRKRRRKEAEEDQLLASRDTVAKKQHSKFIFPTQLD